MKDCKKNLWDPTVNNITGTSTARYKAQRKNQIEELNNTREGLKKMQKELDQEIQKLNEEDTKKIIARVWEVYTDEIDKAAFERENGILAKMIGDGDIFL